MRNLFGGLLLGCTMAIAAPAAAATSPPSQLIVLGDSLVDAGRVWVGTGFQIPPQSDGFFEGRFSNGPTWVDLINRRLTGSFTAPPELGGRNFAVGGSRGADNAFTLNPLTGGVAVLPGLPAQGAQALGSIDTSALYVISFGNNDANALLNGVVQADGTVKLLTVPEQAAFIGRFASNVALASQVILAQGGRVLVGGVPNPLNPFSAPLQTALDAALAPLSAGFGDRLLRYDYAATFTAMARNPAAFGLSPDTSFTEACLDNRRAVAGTIYCTGYFSFDGIHPTKQIHQALARDIAPLVGLNAVPEPQSWALLIAGFGLTGAALRRRRERRPAAQA